MVMLPQVVADASSGIGQWWLSRVLPWADNDTSMGQSYVNFATYSFSTLYLQNATTLVLFCTILFVDLHRKNKLFLVQLFHCLATKA
jgi:hypothetical protein